MQPNKKLQRINLRCTSMPAEFGVKFPSYPRTVDTFYTYWTYPGAVDTPSLLRSASARRKAKVLTAERDIK